MNHIASSTWQGSFLQKEDIMKRSITTLTLFSLIAFVGILQGASPATGPSDAFLKEAAKPVSIPIITEGESIDVTIDEDSSPTPFTLILHATDADNDPLTWGINSGGAHGYPNVTSGTGTSQEITSTPAANFNGSDSFVVRVIDGVDGGDYITVNVTVNPQRCPGEHGGGGRLRHAPRWRVRTGTTGTWNDNTDLVPGALTYAYQWQRADDASGSNAVDIAGATGTTLDRCPRRQPEISPFQRHGRRRRRRPPGFGQHLGEHGMATRRQQLAGHHGGYEGLRDAR